ncbi:MAG: Anion-transporting ATPase, partial [Frankiales bacterium]|nr:Anion-transporting ATPase [Frankiales bacterium]
AAEEGRLDIPALAAGLKEAGLDPDDALVAALAEEATDHAHRVALEERGRDSLAALHRPSYELPLLTQSVDLGSLYRLADLLRDQGLA